MKTNVTFSMDVELRKKLDNILKKRNITMSKLFTNFFENFLEAYKNGNKSN